METFLGAALSKRAYSAPYVPPYLKAPATASKRKRRRSSHTHKQKARTHPPARFSQLPTLSLISLSIIMKITAYTSFLILAVASAPAAAREGEVHTIVNAGALRAAASGLSKVSSSVSLSSVKSSSPQLQAVAQFLGAIPSLKESPEEIPSCADMDMGPDMPEEFQEILCAECGTEIDDVVSCAVEAYTSGADTSSCEACFDEDYEEGEEEKEAEEEEEVPVDVWCPIVQDTTEVTEGCQEAEQCVTDNCGDCAPDMGAIYTCVMTKIVGCDICANAGEGLFAIA